MITYGSLFTGVGGFELGLNKLDWQCKWMNEKEHYNASILKYHWPDIPLTEDIYEISGYDLEPVDVIVGGFPCQTFSSAGTKDGTGLELFDQFVHRVKEMREITNNEYPRAVIWENVAGILNKKRTWISDIYTRWAEIGALVQEHRLVNSVYFGVPQSRRRVIGIVIFDPRAETEREILSQPRVLPKNIRPSFQTGEDTSTADTTSTLIFNPTQITNPDNRSNPQPNGPAPSLVRDGKPPFIIVHNRIRKLTPIECERLMAWPDNHTAYYHTNKAVSDHKRYQMCGNGIVSTVAAWAGLQLQDALC